MSYSDEYDSCLEEVEKICEPMKEILSQCLELANKYNVDKITIYKEMVEMTLFQQFCELTEDGKNV